jgi:hypothetical protein
MPAAMMRLTASPAAGIESKAPSSTRAHDGSGSSLTVISVTTPSIPSEPITSASRS